MIVFEIADIINIIGLIFNLASVFFIAIVFQNVQINSRTLKDYYIKEIDDTLKKILLFIKHLESSRLKPQDIRRDFINHVSLINNIDIMTSHQYGINLNAIITGFLSMQQKVEDDNNFLVAFSSNTDIVLEDVTIQELQNYRYNQLEKAIYETISNINNHKIKFTKLFTWK